MQEDKDGSQNLTPGLEPAPEIVESVGQETTQKTAPLSWTSTEFIANNKSKNWFIALGFIILVVTVGVYLASSSIFSAIVILILGVSFAIVAGRQPRPLIFTINNEGVGLGDKFHAYTEFKSFSVHDEGEMSSVRLNPLKRFTLPTNMYYEKEDETKIVNLLGSYLPNEPVSKDPIDQLMHKIKY